MDPLNPIVEETPAEQRTALLPVEELKQLSLQQFNEYQIQEFRLQGRAESLKDFLDFCFLENGKYNKSRVVWITEHSFVQLEVVQLGGYIALPGDYRDRRFGLRLSTSDVFSHDHELNIHSSTTEGAIAALDLLAGLQDSYFKKIELQYNGGGNRICPLSGRHLENFVRNANRENTFRNMTFTRDQSRTLATSGIRTNIGFLYCKFEDEGIAFVEASAARENQEAGPAKLTIRGRLPFNEGNFRLFLSQNRLESLKLYNIRLRHEESCRALAATDLQNLELHFCGELPDGGAALVESVSEERGPRGLTIGRNQFDSAERFLSFITALRRNSYLKRLDLSENRSRDDVEAQALASALLENQGLVHFGLHRCTFNRHCWRELTAAISTHPTLRTINFRGFRSVGGLSPSIEKRDRTKAIANMLLINKHIDEIPFDSKTFERQDWNVLVAPKVECNLYRKRLSPIPKIKALSTRAAVVGRALVRVEKNPSLVWMVLSQNHDIVCSYLDEARDDSSVSASVPSRKRSRSPSADAMSGH
jgi:hypothetical protein